MKSSLRGALLAAVGAVALLAGASGGNAATATFGTYTLAYADFSGTGPYGTVVVSDLGGGIARFTETVTPNIIINTGNGGNHFPLAFTLAGIGSIDASSVASPFSVATAGSLSQPPFGNFLDGIDGACGSGSSSGVCGGTLTFLVKNFSGLISNSWNPPGNGPNIDIFFAADIWDKDTQKTGDVGASSPTPPIATPLPAALPMFVAGLGFVGWLGRRRRKPQVQEA
jgi:hypothetical protein